MITSNRWVVYLSALTFVLGPCDEVLPPYTEPENFLQGEMSGLYVLGNTANQLSMYLTVTNIFDETLDDTVDFHGTIVIQSARLPHIKKTIAFTAANLQSGIQYYNQSTRRLTLDPEQSISCRVTWDFTTDDRGIDPRKEWFIFYSDPACQGRCRALREELVLSGEIYIFSERAPVKATELFPICYVYPYIGPPACISILTDPPCIEPASLIGGRCSPFGD